MTISHLAAHLEQTGYLIVPDALSDALLARLHQRCQEDDSSRFHPAQIGRGNDKKRRTEIRGDVISWLDERDPTDLVFLNEMGQLRSALNEKLFLGLFDYECHYAIYAAGAGYAKHLDVLHGKKNRILSTVLYLNPDWQSGDGGELDLYDETGERLLATVQPRFGTLVIFLSEVFPHAVRISHTTRRSIAGWFRVSGS